MSRKRIGIALGAVLLAVIAPLLTLVLLHSLQGTARAGAPPEDYTKVSMPDFGQHSTSWCWVAAAANSFWWYAEHDVRNQGLLGGPGMPWKAIDTKSQIPVGQPGYDVCWYDANDTAQGYPNPVWPAVIPGYRQLLSKIAATTFKDANLNGIQDVGENNYCWSQGVEKWDYLIGLRDYVKLYGSGLVVHDIIDSTRCLPNTGYLPNRAAPGPKNARPACGVPGIEQAVRAPTFLDYQTELSRSQDVLLWMEPTIGYPEYAHVVTGVGYDTRTPPVGTVGTITISDPWTHSTCYSPTPPSGNHDDCWPLKARLSDGLMPDHNNAFGHEEIPNPYDECIVIHPGPEPNFQIQCGATFWTVFDMIFVSPAVVGGIAELPDIAQGSANEANLPDDSSSPSALPYIALAGVAAAALFTLTVGAWYARRRWQR